VEAVGGGGKGACVFLQLNSWEGEGSWWLVVTRTRMEARLSGDLAGIRRCMSTPVIEKTYAQSSMSFFEGIYESPNHPFLGPGSLRDMSRSCLTQMSFWLCAVLTQPKYFDNE
jgi:hypothetical protein